MRQFVKTGLKSLSLLAIMSAFTFCTSRNITEGKQDDQKIKKDSSENINSVESTTSSLGSPDDSLALLIELKYPKAIKTDTLRYLFTYSFQELIERNSNLVYFQNGRIKDIEKDKENYVITIDKTFDIQGKFLVKPQLWSEFVKYLNPTKTRLRGGFIVKISSIIPVQAETIINIDDIPPHQGGEGLSGSDLSNYVHLSFDSRTRPFYILNGELIDFYINK